MMLTKRKQMMLVAVGVVLCIVIFGWYCGAKIKEARQAEMDAIIGQGGHLVAIHRFLSRDEKDYRAMQLMGMLANEADEKLRANEAYIVSILPPESTDSFFEMAKELHELAGHAVPSQTKQPAEQVGAGQPATRSESDSEGGDKPQPDPEERSR
jgi:hypothetical protein